MPPTPFATTLLLLPSSTTPSTLLPTLTPHLTSLPPNSRIHIALPAPFQTSNRTRSFSAASRLFAAVYAAVFTISQLNPVLETVDVTVLLTSPDAPITGDIIGPVVQEDELRSRPWTRVVVAEAAMGTEVGAEGAGSEAGERELDRENVEAVERQPEGGVLDVVGGEEHGVVAVGGTFDHLHLGHRLLLSMTAYALSPSLSVSTAVSGGGASVAAAAVGVKEAVTAAREKKKIVIGVSGDALLANKKHAEFLEPWRIRVQNTLNFLFTLLSPCASSPPSIAEHTVSVLAPNAKDFMTGREVTALLGNGVEIQCLELMEPCGPTITDPEITALVVTEETASGGKFVNDTKAQRGLGGLAVLMVGLVGVQGDGGKLSSTDLRKREGERGEGRRSPKESKA